MKTTPEGYLLCEGVPIARTGDMTYLAGELQLDGDPARPVTVHRYPEDVFDPAAMSSFEGKDVTSGHPPEHVGPENHAAYSKGHLQNVRRSGDYLVADLLVKDANLISDVKNNVMREVSCGYLCRYVPDGDGYRQTQIRGNHVAVVPRGRAGHEVAIQDQTAAPAEKGKKHMGKFAETILNALGMAAHEAENPEEVQALVATAVTALDAEPAPAPNAAEPEPVPAADTTGEKLDRILAALDALKEEKKPEQPTLDTLIHQLSSGEGSDSGLAIPEGPARDAALALLKGVQPAVAGIEDQEVRASVSDALINAFKGPDVMGSILQATQQNVQRAADAASMTDFEKLCADQKKAYDARNPHKQKEV